MNQPEINAYFEKEWELEIATLELMKGTLQCQLAYQLGGITFDDVVAAFSEGYRKHRKFMASLLGDMETMGARMYEAYRDYTASFGHAPLTDDEKKQAFLLDVLKEHTIPPPDDDEDEPPPSVPQW